MQPLAVPSPQQCRGQKKIDFDESKCYYKQKAHEKGDKKHMKVRKTYTPNAFKQAIEQLKAEGHIFLGYTWDYACFKDIVVKRCF